MFCGTSLSASGRVWAAAIPPAATQAGQSRHLLCASALAARWCATAVLHVSVPPGQHIVLPASNSSWADLSAGQDCCTIRQHVVGYYIVSNSAGMAKTLRRVWPTCTCFYLGMHRLAAGGATISKFLGPFEFFVGRTQLSLAKEGRWCSVVVSCKPYFHSGSNWRTVIPYLYRSFPGLPY